MEEYEVDLRDYFRVLWKEKWLVVATFAAAVITALVVSFSLPKQYVVETSLLILPPLGTELQEGGGAVGIVFSPETYRGLALAGDLLREVIAELWPEGDGPSMSSLREWMRVEVEQTTAKDFPGRFPLYLRVTVRGSSPDELVAVASAWARWFTAENTRFFLSRTAQSYDYYKQNLDQVDTDLRAKEEDRTAFLRENSLSVLTTEAEALKASYSVLFSELADRRLTLAAEEARLAALSEALLAEPEQLALTRRPNWTYGYLRTQVADAKAGVQELSSAIAYLEPRVEETRVALEEKERGIAAAEARLAQLDREVEVLRTGYETLAAKVQEAKIARAESAEAIQVVDSPTVPDRPVGPNKKMNVAVAGVLGLFAGILLAFTAHYVQAGRVGGERTRVSSQSTHSEKADRPTG